MSERSTSPIEKFEELLAMPRAAQMYGIDTRELRHNHFLHFLFGPIVEESFSRMFIGQLAQVAIADLESHRETNAQQHSQVDGWKALAASTPEHINARCNSAGTKGRPDEVVDCLCSSRQLFRLVIEMKVKAEHYVEQLSGYIVDQRQSSNSDGDATVLGMLLLIPGRGDVRCDFATVGGHELRHCVESAWAECGSSLADPKRAKLDFLIRDYAETLNFLDHMDAMIVSCGEQLRQVFLRAEQQWRKHESMTLLEMWVYENWPWCKLRIMRAVALAVSPSLRAGAYGTKDGTAVDIDFLESGRSTRLPDGCGLYFHWKLGDGFQIRAAVNTNHDGSAERSRALLAALVPYVRQRLESHAPTDTGRSGGSVDGNSCMVARWKNPTYDVLQISDDLRQRVEKMRPVLEETVSSFAEANKADGIVAQAPKLMAIFAS